MDEERETRWLFSLKPNSASEASYADQFAQILLWNSNRGWNVMACYLNLIVKCFLAGL